MSSKSIYSVFVAAAMSLLILGCGSVPEVSQLEKPAPPRGVGEEFLVAIPQVADPLPAVEFLSRNDGDGRFFRDSNPINFALSGINEIWQGTNENWQTNAGNYSRDVEGYSAGDGPGPADLLPAGSEVQDRETWLSNIGYVVQVTNSRDENQSYMAFLDDIRSKNYSVIDGFGPVTEDYAEHAGAYASFPRILASDVTENTRYKAGNNDDYGKYGGQSDAVLGSMVDLARLFRGTYASTSGPKYLFGTPRPWRLNDQGEMQFLGVEELNGVVDGSSETRETITLRIDQYETSVSVIPGLYSSRRNHSSSHEDRGLYGPDSPNARKDNGYPSGHTNAGVLASMAYAYMMPERFAEHMLRGSQLGENRIVAGMHSPVDVIGGRVQALMVATYALSHNPEIAQAAYEQSGDYFGVQAQAAGMSLYDYVHREVPVPGSYVNADGSLNVNVFDNNWFEDITESRDLYEFRLTYGLPQNGDRTLEPIVPQGAEILLETRQPYLSDAQRRAVLYTTEVESGYPLLDSTNGWGRLNLVAAADGYAAFPGDVEVNMDASNGRFNALDWWRNDISGPGMLTKKGSGTLVLTGTNSFTGGTLVRGGVLQADSPLAFGQGPSYVGPQGTIAIAADGSLELSNLTLEEGSLYISMDEDRRQVTVDDVFFIDNAELVLDFSDMDIRGRQNFTLVSAGQLVGQFASVRAVDAAQGDYDVQLRYQSDKLIARVSAR